jgi:hypothetical protein
MRQAGITNVAPWSAAPTVGPVGDTYFNTTNKTLYVSDGTAWNAVGAGGGGIPIFTDAAARDAAIPTPILGQLCVITTGGSYPAFPAGLQEYNGAISGWTPPWNIGWGRVAEAVNSGDQSLTTNNETIACQINNFTFLQNRRYEIRASLAISATLATTRILARIYNATDNNRVNIVDNNTTAQLTRFSANYDFTPTGLAVIKDFRLTFQNASGTGSMSVSGTFPNQAWLRVFDIGPWTNAP